MITLGAGLSAVALATEMPDHSVPFSEIDTFRPGRHPGRNGRLTNDQHEMAVAAWRYFENNFQPDTCLYNSVDGYPNTTMWDAASSLAGLVGAFELGLIEPAVFDERLDCMLDSLGSLKLYQGEMPNKAYDTRTLAPVDYANNPAEIGFSAIDVGRMLTWLAIVKNRYPMHADHVDRVVLRWSFCNALDPAGTLYGGVPGTHGTEYLQEGRLGYEEYAAAGFQLWGFDTTAASAREPFAWLDVQGVTVAYDARDPAKFGAHTYVVTEPYMLAGLELNWDLANDTEPSDTWHSDRSTFGLAKRIYRAQEKRWRDTGILTARTEHHVDGKPYFVYDTLYSDGIVWNTLADTGRTYPELASVSTKAAIGLAALYDTRYTDRLVESVRPMINAERGLHEGYHEVGGKKIEALTANTNGMVLEALVYQTQGKIMRHGFAESLWDRVPNGEYPGNTQCLPRTSDLDHSTAGARGSHVRTVESVKTAGP